MIDLADAYQRLDGIMAGHGLAEHYYAITVVVWNHRTGAPVVEFTASAILKSECVQAWARPSLQDALGTLDRLLADHCRPKEPVPDLHVVVPGVSETPAPAPDACDAF